MQCRHHPTRFHQLQIDAISAQLSPHFVFNSLNAIQHHILLEDKKTSLKFLNIFGKLLRYFLNQLQSDSAYVKDEVQMIEWYLKLQQLRYGNVLDYTIHVNGPAEQAKIPSILVQNLLENLLEEQIHQAKGAISIRAEFSVLSEKVLFRTWINAKLPPTDEPTRPDSYLGSLVPWRKYVELINEIRPYTVEAFTENEPCPHYEEQCQVITLSLPNLTLP